MTDNMSVVEQELITNRREVEIPPYGIVVLKRPTPADDRFIAEARRKAYHADLKNPEVLTRKQIEKILTERGVWDAQKDEDIKDLNRRSTDLMAKLTFMGFTTVDELLNKALALHEELKQYFSGEEVEDAETLLEHLAALFDTETPLAEKGASVVALRKAAFNSTVETSLIEAETAMYTVEAAKELAEVKNEFSEKVKEYATYFSDCAESRADNVERLAKLYQCLRTQDDRHLWDSFEDIWDESPANIARLSTALFYFENGITDEVAEVLQKYGFTERVIATKVPSESLPDHPMSNSDGESQENEPVSS